jgi:hypothetical protein
MAGDPHAISYSYPGKTIMRIRTILFVLALFLVAAFVALNIDEFTRVSLLSLGFTTIQVSLGLVMLVMLAASTVIFLGSAFYMQSTHLLEMRKHTRELNTQRELADKAEASRFTELRSYLETQATAAAQRDAAATTALTERFAQQQQTILARIEQSDNTLAAYMGQLEDKLEHRSIVK